MIFFFVLVESYVKSLGQPGLLDLLVQPSSQDVGMEEVEDLRPSKRKIIYTEVILDSSAYLQLMIVSPPQHVLLVIILHELCSCTQKIVLLSAFCSA